MFALYTKVLKQAFGLVWNHKVFWPASLFLVWPNLAKSLVILILGAAAFDVALVAPEQAGEMSQTDGASLWPALWFAVAATCLVWIYFKSKNVVMLTVKDLQENAATSWAETDKQSSYGIFNLIKTSYSCVVITFALLALYLGPVFYLQRMQYVTRAWILAVLGVMVFVPLVYFVYASMKLVPLFAVLYKMSIKNSLYISLDFAYRRWWLVAGFMAVLLGIEILALAGVVTVLILANGPFVFLGQIFYDVGGLSALGTLSGLAGIVISVLFFAVQAAVAGFSHIAWTLLFLQVVRPVKFVEDEPEVAEPETAS